MQRGPRSNMVGLTARLALSRLSALLSRSIALDPLIFTLARLTAPNANARILIKDTGF